MAHVLGDELVVVPGGLENRCDGQLGGQLPIMAWSDPTAVIGRCRSPVP